MRFLSRGLNVSVAPRRQLQAKSLPPVLSSFHPALRVHICQLL